jgi:hypothetical protein
MVADRLVHVALDDATRANMIQRAAALAEQASRDIEDLDYR